MSSFSDDDDSVDFLPAKRKRPAGPRQKKNFKRIKNQFIEDEASSGDEEDDDVSDDYRNEAKEVEAMQRRLQNRTSTFDRYTPEEIAKRIEERANLRTANIMSSEINSHARQQQLLPGVDDPKLWLVGCRRGKERTAVINLLYKAIHYQQTNQPWLVFSVFASNHVSEFIYVEAYKKAHVVAAIQGNTVLYDNKISLVPNNEMTAVFSMDKANPIKVKAGSFVRIKNGDYKGDLGQVVDLEDQRGRALVKVVPRLEKAGGRRGPQKLFNPADYKEAERKRDMKTQEDYYVYRNMNFVNGFLLKQMSVKSLLTDNVQPSLSELQPFRQNKNDENDVFKAKDFVKKTTFSQGDQVIVTKGDVRGIAGTVINSNEQNVTIAAHDQELGDSTYEFPITDVAKFFTVGNHVKVIGGRYLGKTGMVVSCEDSTANIITDIGKEVIQVLFNDLTYTEDVSTGVEINTPYKVNDIITLINEKSFGLIVKVENECVKAVMDGGDVRNIWPHEIAKRYPPQRGAGTDCDGNSLHTGDMVKIVFKRHRKADKTGSIRNAHRRMLFLYMLDAQESQHIIPVRAQLTQLLGANQQNEGMPQVRREEFLKKMVKIITGPYRGYSGKVIELQERKAKVELSSINRVITIDVNGLEGIKSAVEGIGLSNAYEAQRTPAHSPWPATPAYRDTSSPWPETPSHQDAFREWYTKSPSTHRR